MLTKSIMSESSMVNVVSALTPFSGSPRYTLPVFKSAANYKMLLVLYVYLVINKFSRKRYLLHVLVTFPFFVM